MPYYRRRFTFRKRRYSTRRKYGGKRNYRRKYPKLTTTRMHPEFKTRDISQPIDTAVLDTGLAFNFLDGITQGDGVAQRTGNQITGRSLQYRILPSASASAIGGSPIRLIIGIDKQANGADVDLSAVLSDPTNPVSSPFDAGTASRYIILRDKVYNLDADDPSKFIKGYIRLNSVVKWDDGDAQPQVNNLWAVILSNRGSGEYPPVANYFWRYRFTDI